MLQRGERRKKRVERFSTVSLQTLPAEINRKSLLRRRKFRPAEKRTFFLAYLTSGLSG